MNSTKTLLAALAGGLTLFALGYLIYMVIFGNADFYMAPGEKAGMRADLVLWPIILMEILYGLLLAITFGRLAGISTFSGGLKAGAVIGLLLGACVGLDYFATTAFYSLTVVLFWGITYAIRFAVAGGVAGMVLGSGKGS